MACPYFVPQQKAPHPSRPLPARTPLGALYGGACDADALHQPDADELYDCCNVGYARGRCSHFPETAEADAVRFSLHRDKLLYVLEREHAPVRFGEVPATAGVLAAQARAFSDNHPR